MKILTIATSLALVCLVACAQTSTSADMTQSQKVQSQYKGYEALQEKQNVQDVVTTMVNAIDTKLWDVAEGEFTPTVFVDYSSMTGQPGTQLQAKELVGGWKNLLKSVDTHHMLTNFSIQVDGNKARSQSHVYASHLAEDIDYWDIFGLYLHELEKINGTWKITSMTLIVHGQKGNTEFLSQVSQQ